MVQLTVPPSVSQSIARAKNLIKRNEIVRAIDALSTALEGFIHAKIIGKARFVVEVNILECVTELNAHHVVRTFLETVAKSSSASISYTPGEEEKLLTILGIIGKALVTEEAAKEAASADAVQGRKDALFAKAAELLAAGEGPRAKAVLRNLGEEFGSEPGVLAAIGTMLLEAEFDYDAIDFFVQAIETFPRDPTPYAPLSACYLKFREFAKGEALYLSALREFGAHPRTLLHLGKLYIAWNKRDKAFDVLRQVVQKCPDDEEAKELFAKVDR
ncbi:MAG: hypothetical protein DELT_02097 [Desulfovibrio sp.]